MPVSRRPKQKLLIAIGGNAISLPDRKESAEKRLKRLEKFAARLKPLMKRYSLILTHGNGSDIGHLLLGQEMTKKRIVPLPVDTLGAMTQGQLGYWLGQAIENRLKTKVVTLVTRVAVDRQDRAFRHKTKPIGPYYRKKVFGEMTFVRGKGYRRVIASPRPIRILEEGVIKKLFHAGTLLIAAGGGGIPVIRRRNRWIGVEGVIDKDFCAAKLGKLVKADILLILTNADGVYLHFGTKRAKKIRRLSVSEAKNHLKNGEFAVGSMRPKIMAGIEFLKGGGKKCFVGSWKKLDLILKGKSGTKLVSDRKGSRGQGLPQTLKTSFQFQAVDEPD